MTTQEALYPLPGRAKTISAMAQDYGWDVKTTYAGGDPKSVVLLFRQEGRVSVYAIWMEAKWGWSRTQDMKSLKQGELVAYLKGETLSDDTDS